MIRNKFYFIVISTLKSLDRPSSTKLDFYNTIVLVVIMCSLRTLFCVFVLLPSKVNMTRIYTFLIIATHSNQYTLLFSTFSLGGGGWLITGTEMNNYSNKQRVEFFITLFCFILFIRLFLGFCCCCCCCCCWCWCYAVLTQQLVYYSANSDPVNITSRSWQMALVPIDLRWLVLYGHFCAHVRLNGPSDLRYAHAEIRTPVGMICGPTRYRYITEAPPD